MEGQYFGAATSADGTQLGLLWTILDPGMRTGTAVFTDAHGRAYVLQLNLVEPSAGQPGEVCFELVPNRLLEQVYTLETPVPDGTSVRCECRRVDAYRVEGSFDYSSGEERRQGKFDVYLLWSPPSQANQTFESWAACKAWLESHRLEGESLYRGQSRPLPLVTSFHRTGRVDLFRWLQRDMPIFADQVSAVLERKYDWNNLVDRGALVGLAQHHGFPSPMLDWSRSPYISAYFAFAGVVESPPGSDPVRMFRLRPEFLRDHPVTAGTLMAISPTLRIQLFRPAAFGNARLVAQQGVMLFTNVPSPEAFLRMIEKNSGGHYLEVVDVNRGAAKEALADLRRMGITAASLFPGLDGVGLALKHELFFAS